MTLLPPGASCARDAKQADVPTFCSNFTHCRVIGTYAAAGLQPTCGRWRHCSSLCSATGGGCTHRPFELAVNAAAKHGLKSVAKLVFPVRKGPAARRFCCFASFRLLGHRAGFYNILVFYRFRRVTITGPCSLIKQAPNLKLFLVCNSISLVPPL